MLERAYTKRTSWSSMYPNVSRLADASVARKQLLQVAEAAEAVLQLQDGIGSPDDVNAGMKVMAGMDISWEWSENGISCEYHQHHMGFKLNENNSLTWNVQPFLGWFPLSYHHSSEGEQWGRYNWPRKMKSWRKPPMNLISHDSNGLVTVKYKDLELEIHLPAPMWHPPLRHGQR